MTQSLSRTRKYNQIGSNIPDEYLSALSRFQNGPQLQTYVNTAEVLNYYFAENSLCRRYFKRLKIVSNVLQLADWFLTHPNLEAAPTAKHDGNPVISFHEFPIAAYILSPLRSGDKRHPNQSAYELITSLYIVILLSGPNNPGLEFNKYTKYIAIYLRRLNQSNEKSAELMLIESRIPKFSGLYDLISFIKSQSMKGLFSWMSELMRLNPIDAGDQIEVKNPLITSSLPLHNYSITGDRHTSVFGLRRSDEKQGDSGVIASFAHIGKLVPDSANIDPDPEVPKTTSILEETNKLKKTRLQLIKHLAWQPPKTMIRQARAYDIAIFNPIEREWLKHSLNQKAPLSSLIVSLLILTGCTPKELGKKTIGRGGQITEKGEYRRKIPKPRNAKKPNAENSDLYEPNHIDSFDQLLVLSLPEFVIELITAVVPGNAIRIKELCKQSDQKLNEIVKSHVKILREEHGARFIPKRISGQLKNYISANIQDPSVTYALFGKNAFQAPTAFYYRSLKVSELQSVYSNAWQEYFLCD